MSDMTHKRIDELGLVEGFIEGFEFHRAREELGWKPQFQDFESGMADTVKWYQEHQDWWRPKKAAIEAAYAAKGQ